MDMATAAGRRRARPTANANSAGSTKRRKIKFSGNPRCVTLGSDDDGVSVSCCSTHTEKGKKLKFVDLGVEFLDVHLNCRRGNDESSSEVEEESEEEDMDSGEVTLSELSSKDVFRIHVDGLQLLHKVEAPKIMKPTEAEIEDFFAAAKAENLHQLHHFKKKYNFDFAKEEPLEGRFEWRRCKQ